MNDNTLTKQLYIKEPQLYIIGPITLEGMKCIPISVGVTTDPIKHMTRLQKRATPKLKYYSLVQRDTEEDCYMSLLSIFDNMIVQGEEWIDLDNQILANLKRNRLISNNLKIRLSKRLKELYN